MHKFFKFLLHKKNSLIFTLSFFSLFSKPYIYAENDLDIKLECPKELSIEDLSRSKFLNEYDKNELPKEYYPNKKIKGVFLVVHGLNLRPSKMNPLINYLTNKGYYVLRASLSGHRGSLKEQKYINWRKWEQDQKLHLCFALRKAKKLQLPLFNLSYSLGAQLSLTQVLKLNQNPYNKMIFFAPSLWIHWYGELISYFDFLDGEIGLPSWNHEGYRSQSTTSINSYRASQQGRVFFNSLKNTDKLGKTLVVVDPEDEIVSLKKIKSFLNQNKLKKKWKILELSSKEKRPPHSYHHLIIDEQSLGGARWNKLLRELSTFLDNKGPQS